MKLRHKSVVAVAAFGLMAVAVFLVMPRPSQHAPESRLVFDAADVAILELAEQGRIAETLAALENRSPSIAVDANFGFEVMRSLVRNSAPVAVSDYLRSRKDRSFGMDMATALAAGFVAETGEIEAALQLLPVIEDDGLLQWAHVNVVEEMVLHGRTEEGLAILERIENKQSWIGRMSDVVYRARQAGSMDTARAVLEYAEPLVWEIDDSDLRAAGLANIAAEFAFIGDLEAAYRILGEFPESVWPGPETEGDVDLARIMTSPEHKGLPFGARAEILSAIAYAHAERHEFDAALRIAESIKFPYLRDHTLFSTLHVVFREDWPTDEMDEKMGVAEMLLAAMQDDEYRNEIGRCRAAERSAMGDWDEARRALGWIDGVADWLGAYALSLWVRNSGENPCA